jgi:hypothetical protein
MVDAAAPRASPNFQQKLASARFTVLQFCGVVLTEHRGLYPQFVEQPLASLRLRVSNAREPAADLGEYRARLVATTLLRERAGEAHCCPQF